MTKSRKGHVQARWKQHKYDLSVFEKLFRKVEESSFLRGNNKRNWKPDFDWLMDETNMAKVLEGRYDDNKEWNPAWEEADGGKQEKIKKVDTDKIVEDVFKSLEVDDGQAVKK